MASIVNRDEYMFPHEASARLNVSHKTLQRWAESQQMSIWVDRDGSMRRETKPVQIEYVQTTTRYRYYKRASIEKLAEELNSDR